MKSKTHSGFRILFFGFVLTIVVYGIMRATPLLRGVSIDIQYDQNIANSGVSYITIYGSAKGAKRLELNGKQIAITKDGEFKEGVVLYPGSNKMTMISEDVRGKIKTKEFTIVTPLLD
jgi:uncharacterized protein YfaP (DUF2135 family)